MVSELERLEAYLRDLRDKAAPTTEPPPVDMTERMRQAVLAIPFGLPEKKR